MSFLQRYICPSLLLTQGIYREWAEKNQFVSMLPKDVQERKDKVANAAKQCRLDSHLEEIPAQERVAPYTDHLFREATIEWLVSTDQVSVHLIFELRNMLETALFAADSGVGTPSFQEHD